MSGDTWLLEYDGVVKLGQETMEHINERNRESRGSSTHSKFSAKIRSMLKQYGNDVNKLRDGLIQLSARRRITDREAERRQSLMDQLVTKEKQLERAFQSDQEDLNIQRSALFGNPLDDDVWGNSSRTAATASSNDPLLDIGEISQQQQQIIREQDSGLDALSNVLSRQKQMAIDIGNEVDYQDEIIDDIHDHVDRTDQRLIRETKHIKIVDRKSNTCCFWVIAGLLLVAILIVLFVPFNGHF